jgi:two-component system response regulator PhoP
MRILVIEDEQALRNQLHEQLSSNGYSVNVAEDGEEGLFYGREYPQDLAVVDIGLPKLSGIEVIKKLRSEGFEYPIIILTARGNWQDKVEGLEAGADDYLVKPFHIEELLARLNALLRRSAGLATPELECGPIKRDTVSQTIQVNQEPLSLTAYEYRIMEYLMLNTGKVISKTELTEHIYEQDFDRDSNVLEVLVGRLRRKLDPENSIKPIETLRGRGYRFTLERT